MNTPPLIIVSVIEVGNLLSIAHAGNYISLFTISIFVRLMFLIQIIQRLLGERVKTVGTYSQKKARDEVETAIS